MSSCFVSNSINELPHWKLCYRFEGSTWYVLDWELRGVRIFTPKWSKVGDKSSDLEDKGSYNRISTDKNWTFEVMYMSLILLQIYFWLHRIKDLDLRMLEFKFFKKKQRMHRRLRRNTRLWRKKRLRIKMESKETTRKNPKRTVLWKCKVCIIWYVRRPFFCGWHTSAFGLLRTARLSITHSNIQSHQTPD